MIHINGYAQEILDGSPSFNEQGAPIHSLAIYGEKLPCMWRALANDKQGQGKDNKHSRMSYAVHIDPKSISSKRMRLLRLDESLVGEFTIQSVETALIHSFTKIILD